MTYNEIIDEIMLMQVNLRNTDYQALKHADGALTDEEYAEMKTTRQGYRDRINELEALLPDAIEEAEEEAKALEAEMEADMARQDMIEQYNRGEITLEELQAVYPDFGPEIIEE